MSNYRANAAGSDRKQHGQVFIMNAEAFIQTYSSCALWRKCHWSECQKSVEVYGWRLDRPWLRPLSASVAWSPTGLSSPYLLFGPGQCQICSKQWDLENQPKPNGQALCDSHFSEKEGGIDRIQCWDSKSWFVFNINMISWLTVVIHAVYVLKCSASLNARKAAQSGQEVQSCWPLDL